MVVFMKNWFRFSASGVALLLLGGCWHVPVSAIWRLRKVDLVTIDPQGIRGAVRAPDWLEAPPGHIHFKIIRHEGEADEKETAFDLVAQESSRAPSVLAGEAMSGTHFAILRVSAAEAARLREIQAQAQAAKAAGAAPHKTRMLLTSEPCRRIDPPPGPVRVDLYLSLSEKEEFFKVYDDVDLREMTKPGESFETAFPLCGKTAKRAD
jgi:hypothetical protein